MLNNSEKNEEKMNESFNEGDLKYFKMSDFEDTDNNQEENEVVLVEKKNIETDEFTLEDCKEVFEKDRDLMQSKKEKKKNTEKKEIKIKIKDVDVKTETKREQEMRGVKKTVEIKPEMIGKDDIDKYTVKLNDESLSHVKIFEAFNYVRLPRASYLIDKHIVENSLAMIYGPSGAGKSFFALEICKSLLMGIPLFGRYATKKSSVLYLASESESSFISRLESIAEYNNISLESLEGFYFYPNGYDLKDKDSADEIIKIINALPTKPSLFIVDTLSRNLHGDENSSKDTSALVQICDDIRRETKITVLLVHHTGKDDVRGPRGHSSLFAACDTVIKVSGGPIMTTCQVICEKLKDGFPFSSYVLEKTPVILNNPVDIRFKEGLVLTLDENNPTKSNESIMSDFIELFPENEENAITLKEVWDKYRGYFDEVGWRSQQTLKNKMVIARTMKQVKYRLMYTRCGKNNHFKYYKKLNDSVEK